jgi:hypothetical protein
LHNPRSTASRRQPATEQVLAFSRLCSRLLVKRDSFLLPGVHPLLLSFLSTLGGVQIVHAKVLVDKGQALEAVGLSEWISQEIGGANGTSSLSYRLTPRCLAAFSCRSFPGTASGGSPLEVTGASHVPPSSSSHVREVTTIAHTLDARLANYASAAGDVTVAGSPFNGLPRST